MAASRFIAAKIRISAQFHHERRCFFIPKKAKRAKKAKKHFVFGNFVFFGCFRNRKFLYPEKGGKGEKDENVVLSCSSCLQKNNGRFVIKDNEDNFGQLFYQELENWRIGEIRNSR